MRTPLFGLLVFISTACGTESQLTENQRSGASEKQKVTVSDTTKGALALQAPKKKPNDKAHSLEVTIRRSADCWAYDQVDGVEVADFDPSQSVSSDDSPDGQSLIQVASDNDGPDQDIAPIPEPGPICALDDVAQSTQTIILGEKDVLTFDALDRGFYDIEVRLVDAKGEILEEGYAGAEVLPGQTSFATVQLFKTSGDGSLTIEILRAGDIMPPECDSCDAKKPMSEDK